MELLNLFQKILYIIMNFGKRQDENTYTMLDATMIFSGNGITKITTEHLEIIKINGIEIYAKDRVEIVKGNPKLIYNLINRLENYLKDEEKKTQELLVSKRIELNGIVYKEDNGECYSYASWGDLNDEQQKISLQNVLFNNFGRKAKIIIEFED